MNYRELFSFVHTHRGMVLLDDSFQSAVAFVAGCDAGNDGGLLRGFREWLIVSLGRGTNLAWPALVMMRAFPPDVVGRPLSARLPDDENKIAVDTLFNLLDEFFYVLGHDGLGKIFVEHDRLIARRKAEWEAKWAGRDA